MRTTFTITNTRLEDGDLIVFFEFSNGELNSSRFDPADSVADIQQWGIDRALFFDQRERALADQAEQLFDQQSDPNITP